MLQEIFNGGGLVNQLKKFATVVDKTCSAKSNPNFDRWNEKKYIEIVSPISVHLDELLQRAHNKSHCSRITYVKDRMGHGCLYANTLKLKSEQHLKPTETFKAVNGKMTKWPSTLKWMSLLSLMSPSTGPTSKLMHEA
jgi:dTDP-D-glucose 4,6-dehydratase